MTDAHASSCTITDGSLDPLFRQIDTLGISACLILTPNKRLSRFINDQYNRYCDNKDLSAWPSIPCYSYRGWVQQQWDRLSLSSTQRPHFYSPLSPLQEALIWEQTLQNHPDTPALLALKSTVQLAMNAWRLRHEWQLDLNEYSDPNTQLFNNWCLHFQTHCDQLQTISAAQQPTVISEAIAAQQLKSPQQLFLVGFDEIAPQMEQLLEALKYQGCAIDTFEFAAANSTRERFEFSERSQEIEAAALWAKQQVEINSAQRLAIIVPDLAQQRDTLERIFNNVFEPQNLLPQNAQHAPGFNLSAAQPLHKMPLINIGLAALNLNKHFIDVEQASKLLRSPFLGVLEELEQRAIADTLIRGHEFDVSLKQIKLSVGSTGNRNAPKAQPQSAEETSTGYKLCPDFHLRLDNFERQAKTLPNATYPSDWIVLLQEQLSLLGWPGNRKLDTFEFQQLQSWQESLDIFASLDHITGKISLSQAINYLNQVIAQATFKAQTKDSPIQILGILEAAGLPFDAIWLMGLDDETWPPAPNPNPLIPIALQTQLQLPQSAANRELKYARRLTQRFQNSTNRFIVSHATHRDDQEQSPSPLAVHIPVQPFSIMPDKSYADSLLATEKLESSWDACGPHVGPSEPIRGGSQLLKDQAACPFRAFARHRLHSDSIPQITVGLDASERGNLLHTALEIIWRRLRHQQKLLATDQDTLTATVDKAIEQALVEIKTKRFVGERFIEIEKQRLHTQVMQWLNLEKQRAPFTVVLNEGKRTLKLGQLAIHIRYDRVDRLDDGSLFVLDYKTGKQSIGAWSNERPDEPQVPLYSIANQKKVVAAAFGQINAEEIAIKGIAADTSLAPGLSHCDKITVKSNSDNWDKVIEQWREVLEKLAQEFMAGAADVSPKKFPLTCQYCDLAQLCRIKEQQALMASANGFYNEAGDND